MQATYTPQPLPGEPHEDSIGYEVFSLLQENGGGVGRQFSMTSTWNQRLVQSFRRGEVSPYIIVRVYSKAGICSAGLEDYASGRKAASRVSMSIRQLIYGVFAYVERSRLHEVPGFGENSSVVIEYHRKEGAELSDCCGAMNIQEVEVPCPSLTDLTRVAPITFLQKHLHFPVQPESMANNTYGAAIVLYTWHRLSQKSGAFSECPMGLAIATTYLAARQNPEGARREIVKSKKCLARFFREDPSDPRNAYFDLLHDAIEISNVWSYLTTLANLLGCVCQVGTSGIVLPCITELFSSGQFTHHLAELILKQEEINRKPVACQLGEKLVDDFHGQSLDEMVSWIDAAISAARPVKELKG